MSTVWSFNYIAITNQVEKAQLLDQCGIQQIMVDVENLGKAERQAGKNAVINYHQIEDAAKLKNAGIKAKIICRINGFYEGIDQEIEQAINSGADTLMLPMILDIKHFEQMLEQISRRIAVIPLIETPYSVFKLNQIIELAKPTQIHFGLNDLHLGLGMKNLFEILLSPVFASAVAYARDKVQLVGIGGVGHPEISQKVMPELLINEYKRLGSRSVILSRSFFSQGYNHKIIKSALEQLETYTAEKTSEIKHTELKLQIETF